MCPFDYTTVAESWNVGPVNQVNHTSWVAVVTPNDRPKSGRNRYVIELFCGVVCVVTLPFWLFCWYRGFCHRTESDLFLFLLCIRARQMWTCTIFTFIRGKLSVVIFFFTIGQLDLLVVFDVMFEGIIEQQSQWWWPTYMLKIARRGLVGDF